MAPLRGGLWAVCLVGLIAASTGYGIAQTAEQPDATPPPAAAPAPATPAVNPAAPPVAQPAAPDAPAAEPAAPAKRIYAVPAGTKVLLQLKSAVNTKSAKAGDGVYLISIFPVVVGNRVMIPNGVYVQGVVDRVQRGGRIKGKAQLDMHFTSIIFPNGSVVEIPGVVDSVPGTKNQTVKDNGEGTIEQNGDKGRNAGRAAEIALPTGAGVGTIVPHLHRRPTPGQHATWIGLGAAPAGVGLSVQGIFF